MKNVINSTIKLKLNKCATHTMHQNLSKYMKFYYWIEIKIWYILTQFVISVLSSNKNLVKGKSRLLIYTI